MRELKGKVAVVTGAASGIGRAMAERFAREGMKVVLADVEEKPLGEARDAIANTGAETLAVHTDVSRPDQVDELARRTFEAFGSAHVVCNNAGIAMSGAVWTHSIADWEWILGVNLWGVVNGLRAFVPRLVEQGEGHVVNTASIAGLISAPRMAAYFATGGKVNVSVLCPAWVKTKISDSGRNRPATLADSNRERSPQDQMTEQRTRAAVLAGIPAEVVAEKVLRAIVEERFWILTHSKTKKDVEARIRGLLEDRAPVFSVPRED